MECSDAKEQNDEDDRRGHGWIIAIELEEVVSCCHDYEYVEGIDAAHV